MKYDFLIVGAGLAGATASYELTRSGKKCLVIDKRPHIAGNIYTENIEGINIHKYGAHIFHTSDKKIWDYVNSFIEFNRYTNCPIANAPDGHLYNLPFNMNTFYQLWGVKTPEQALSKIEDQRIDAINKMKSQGIIEPRNLEEQALILVGRDIYELLIKHYTEKQWGRKCIDLPAFIIRRLPIRLTFDNNYFKDTYQGIPIGGYTRLIELMLQKSDLNLNTDYFEHKDELDKAAKKIIFTGEIDRFYNYCFGNLQYRTVYFKTKTLDIPNYQGNAVVNYTDAVTPFTRIIEHKHFENFGNEVYDNPITIISEEYSKEWHPGDEPYYPINNTRNNNLYQQYKALADKENRVIFCGRLAEYRYYDMHQVIKETIDKISLIL